MPRLYILHSGYVTDVPVRLVQVEKEMASIQSRLYTPDYRITDTENYYDESVEDLFMLYRKDPKALNLFEFRESILKLAIRLFNNRPLQDWVELQLQQRSVQFLHRRFIEETISFIEVRARRKMEHLQYYRLLNATEPVEIHAKNDVAVDDKTKQWISNHQSPLHETLALWTKDLRGYVDLLMTLHVIFGRRQGHITVSIKRT